MLKGVLPCEGLSLPVLRAMGAPKLVLELIIYEHQCGLILACGVRLIN